MNIVQIINVHKNDFLSKSLILSDLLFVGHPKINYVVQN
jgi:hypothetical protein